MPHIVRSAKGEFVDFDLIRIKNQLADTPAPVEVKSREDFVQRRMRRKLRTTSPIMTDEQQSVPETQNDNEARTTPD